MKAHGKVVASVAMAAVMWLGASASWGTPSEVIVNSWYGSANSYTFMVDPGSLLEKTGYSFLSWSGLAPQTAVSGNTVYIGAGQYLFRYHWNGSAFTDETISMGWGEITDLAVAGNGDILVNSRANATAHYTFVADPVTLAAKSASLAWGANSPEAAVSGSKVYIGAGSFLFRYDWNGSAFTEEKFTTGWGNIIDLGVTGDGELIVNSKPNPTAGYTWVADSTSLTERSGYTPLVWGSLSPELAVDGNTVYMGAGANLFRYTWNGSAFTDETVSPVNWGTITDIELMAIPEPVSLLLVLLGGAVVAGRNGRR